MDSANNRIIELQAQLEEQTNINKMKDEMIDQLRKQIKLLQSDQFSRMNVTDQFDNVLFSSLEQENDRITDENIELKERLLKSMVRKNEYKKKYEKLRAVAQIGSPARTGAVADLAGLKGKVAELSTELEYEKEQSQLANERNEKYKKRLDEYKEIIKKMKIEAKQDFQILHDKLDDARQGKDNAKDEMKAELEKVSKERDSLQNELNELRETMNNLDETARQYNATQMQFMSALENMLGCRDLTAALKRVEELSRLSNKMEEMERTSPSYVMDALREIQQNFQPNTLNLPDNSELRQLFAALYNMVNAALDPSASKSLLNPHVRAVVFQARLLQPSK